MFCVAFDQPRNVCKLAEMLAFGLGSRKPKRPLFTPFQAELWGALVAWLIAPSPVRGDAPGRSGKKDA
jgi:hypothetical protein